MAVSDKLAIIQKHDIRLEQIKLNKEIPKIEFNLNSEDSYVHIHSVYVTAKNNSANQWSIFISNVQLTAELKYVSFDDQQERFVDERRKQFPIHLVIDPYQAQPLFQLNKIIKNEMLTVGVNLEPKFYQTLKLELQNIENLDEDYTLELTIETYNIDA